MFWLTFSQIVSRLIRAVIIIYAARVLGAAEYGIFSYALGLASFFTIFADIGIGQILTREVSQKPEKASLYFSTAFWIKAMLLFGTSLLILFAAPHFSKLEAATALLPFVAFLVVFDNLREFSNTFFRAKEKMEYEGITTVLMNISITAFGFIAISISATASSFALSYVASTGAGFLAAAFILREEFFHVIKNFDRSLIRPLLRSAWPIALTSLLGAFMLNVDIIILGWLRTAAEIGYYSAGQKVVQVLYTIPSIITSALFPALSRAVSAHDPKKVASIMEKGAAAIFLLAFPLATGGIVLGKPIILFLYGAEYLPGAAVFQILISTVLVVFPGMLLGNLILAYDRQKSVAVYVALTSIGNVVLDVLLLPLLGIAGVALSTLAVQIMYNIFLWNLAKKINFFRALFHIRKSFIASVLMGIVAYFLNRLGFHVLITIAASGAAYLICLYLLKEHIVGEIKGMIRTART
ncbi:MAG: flippase [Candidatus Jorgensenbacteria bacterium]|nr:flippase [Candidatus Jorgensenbacteria bacterium]